MNSNVNLINAGKYLNRICADMSVSKLYYYNIQYTLSTTILEYQLKHNLTSKDMASYLEVSPSMLSNYESGDYDFSLSQICDICESVGYKDFGCVCKNSCI